MKFVVAVIIGLISMVIFPGVFAQEPACRVVRASGASLVEACGEQLNAFALKLLETKLGVSGVQRQAQGDLHGRFSFVCPIELMCGDEPLVGGFFIAPEIWNKSSKDEEAIYRASQRVPLLAVSSSQRGGPPPTAPTAACPLFDVSVDGMAGRAVCYEDLKSKVTSVIVVAADDRVGFLLSFYQHDKSATALRDNVLALLPRFKIERATGDVGLLEWFR